MSAAFSWIGELIDFLVSFLPTWVIIRKNEKAVKFPGGRGCKVLEPGVRWYWPAFTEVEGPIPVVRQVMNTSTLTLLTRDGREVIAEGVAVYTIEDVESYLVDTHDADQAIEEMVSAAIRDVITSKDLSEIQANSRKTTDNALTREARELVQDFGVEIEYVRLTNFSTAKALNCIGAAPMLDYEDEDE